MVAFFIIWCGNWADESDMFVQKLYEKICTVYYNDLKEKWGKQTENFTK